MRRIIIAGSAVLALSLALPITKADDPGDCSSGEIGITTAFQSPTNSNRSRLLVSRGFPLTTSRIGVETNQATNSCSARRLVANAWRQPE